MNIYRKFERLITRRDFLKTSGLISTGAIGCVLGLESKRSFAGTSILMGSRVVWTHNDLATSWDGVTGHYRDFVDQDKISIMIERGIKELTGRSNPIAAWRQIIPNYSAGKKIVIKVNINNQARDTEIDALYQPVNGVIGGLKSMGVHEPDIYIMDPSRAFPIDIGAPILAKYPDVCIWGSGRGMSFGREVSYHSTDPSLTIRHALHPKINDSKLPDQLGEASYLINMPILKGHHPLGAIITLTFKNNLGFFPAGEKIGKFHPYCWPRNENYSYENNPLLDIYLNDHIRDKTVLIIGDAIFAHRSFNSGIPEVWKTFKNQFPNSLFFSRDPVAIDSVMWDFSDAEYEKAMEGQLYLHRAMELGLGIHEHWNNSADKLYKKIDFKKVDLSIT